MGLCRWLCVVPGLLLLAACSEQNPVLVQNNGPEQVANTFYRLLLAEPVSGIPSADELRPFRAVLHQDLIRRLEAARSAEQRYLTGSKEPVPPLFEGSLFTSLFEGITDFHLDSCQTRRRTSDCLITLIYDKHGQRSEWQDELRLRQGRLGWQISDVTYGGKWDFAPKGTLQQRLDAVLVNEQATTSAAQAVGDVPTSSP